MADTQNDKLALDIQRRATALNISITKLCRDAGVSRRWFEYFKKRTPKAVEAYVKIAAALDTLEKETATLDKVTFTCPRTMRARQGVVRHHLGIAYAYCEDTNESYLLTSVLDLEYITE